MTTLVAPAMVGLDQPELGIAELVTLLSGLGAEDPGLTVVPAVAAGRTCIDGGAPLVLAVRAPGPRALDVEIRQPDAQGSQQWAGLRARPGGDRRHWSRQIWSGTSARTPAADDPFSAQLSSVARVWTRERDADGRTVAVAWHIDRHQSMPEVLARLGRATAWAPAAAQFDALHGFAVSTTSGPWSISRRPGGRDGLLRLGTTRWSWSVDDDGKRRRLAGWIDDHGGDGAYASALYDLLLRSRGTGRPVPIGRAVEVDLDGDQVVAVSAYLVAPTAPIDEGNRP